jgi:hypothetical protein
MTRPVGITGTDHPVARNRESHSPESGRSGILLAMACGPADTKLPCVIERLGARRSTRRSSVRMDGVETFQLDITSPADVDAALGPLR